MMSKLQHWKDSLRYYKWVRSGGAKARIHEYMRRVHDLEQNIRMLQGHIDHADATIEELEHKIQSHDRHMDWLRSEAKAQAKGKSRGKSRPKKKTNEALDFLHNISTLMDPEGLEKIALDMVSQGKTTRDEVQEFLRGAKV
jgi:chromosome segregation ATPase